MVVLAGCSQAEETEGCERFTFTAKTRCLFDDHMHSGCPGCRQTEETVVMTGCFGSEDYWHKAT